MADPFADDIAFGTDAAFAQVDSAFPLPSSTEGFGEFTFNQQDFEATPDAFDVFAANTEELEEGEIPSAVQNNSGEFDFGGEFAHSHVEHNPFASEAASDINIGLFSPPPPPLPPRSSGNRAGFSSTESSFEVADSILEASQPEDDQSADHVSSAEVAAEFDSVFAEETNFTPLDDELVEQSPDFEPISNFAEHEVAVTDVPVHVDFAINESVDTFGNENIESNDQMEQILHTQPEPALIQHPASPEEEETPIRHASFEDEVAFPGAVEEAPAEVSFVESSFDDVQASSSNPNHVVVSNEFDFQSSNDPFSGNNIDDPFSNPVVEKSVERSNEFGTDFDTFPVGNSTTHALIPSTSNSSDGFASDFDVQFTTTVSPAVSPVKALVSPVVKSPAAAAFDAGFSTDFDAPAPMSAPNSAKSTGSTARSLDISSASRPLDLEQPIFARVPAMPDPFPPVRPSLPPIPMLIVPDIPTTPPAAPESVDIAGESELSARSSLFRNLFENTKGEFRMPSVPAQAAAPRCTARDASSLTFEWPAQPDANGYILEVEQVSPVGLLSTISTSSSNFSGMSGFSTGSQGAAALPQATNAPTDWSSVSHRVTIGASHILRRTTATARGLASGTSYRARVLPVFSAALPLPPPQHLAQQLSAGAPLGDASVFQLESLCTHAVGAASAACAPVQVLDFAAETVRLTRLNAQLASENAQIPRLEALVTRLREVQAETLDAYNRTCAELKRVVDVANARGDDIFQREKEIVRLRNVLADKDETIAADIAEIVQITENAESLRKTLAQSRARVQQLEHTLEERDARLEEAAAALAVEHQHLADTEAALKTTQQALATAEEHLKEGHEREEQAAREHDVLMQKLSMDVTKLMDELQRVGLELSEAQKHINFIQPAADLIINLRKQQADWDAAKAAADKEHHSVMSFGRQHSKLGPRPTLTL